MPPEPLVEARGVSRAFPGRGGAPVLAVDGVTLALHPGETVALVGESGSGKSTLGRMVLGLTPPGAGAVLFRGVPVPSLRGKAWRRFRREAQVVFQDSGASLNPRRTAGQSVAAPLRHNLGLSRAAASARADELLDEVGLAPARFRDRLPHELSGGQRQRVGIARAVASRPAFVVADEPVSALDVSIRAQILRLMMALQQRDGLAYLFITHDIGVVRAVAHRVAVMYRGALVEHGPAPALLAGPRHPYTQALMDAVPAPDPSVPPRPPSARPPGGALPPGGCRFRDRCPRAAAVCATDPPWAAFDAGAGALCHFPL